MHSAKVMRCWLDKPDLRQQQGVALERAAHDLKCIFVVFELVEFP